MKYILYVTKWLRSITAPVVSIRGIFIVNIPSSYLSSLSILIISSLYFAFFCPILSTDSPPRTKYIRKGVILMDIIFCQPVTNETISIVRERYTSLGWGEIYLRGNGNNVTELHFKWCKKHHLCFQMSPIWG